MCTYNTHTHACACAHTFIAPQYSYTEENSGDSKSTDYNDYVSRVDKEHTERSFGHCGEQGRWRVKLTRLYESPFKM